MKNIERRLDEMQKRICDLEDMVLKLGGNLKAKPLDLVVKLVLDHLEHGYHQLTHDTDLILMRDLVRVMEAVEPEEEFFSLYNRDYTKIAKRLGAMLKKSGAMTRLRGCYYIPVDPFIEGDKPTNVSRNIWVLRNLKKYKKLGPAQLDREYEKQWKQAQRNYADMVKEKDDEVEDEPSFM